jgi:hypothetical protein
MSTDDVASLSELLHETSIRHGWWDWYAMAEVKDVVVST